MPLLDPCANLMSVSLTKNVNFCVVVVVFYSSIVSYSSMCIAICYSICQICCDFLPYFLSTLLQKTSLLVQGSYRKQPLYSIRVGVSCAYISPSLDPTYGITLGLLSLLFCIAYRAEDVIQMLAFVPR